MDGIFIVDKPIKKTSFDMVRETRKNLKQKKVGHIGTLDPMATGVLVILVGNATKLSDYLMEHDKEYIATIFLGEKKDTGDSEGSTIEEKEVPKIDINDVKETLKSFLGKSKQLPPMYSAIKVNGKKLYDLARKGIEIERKERTIEITDIELLKLDKNNEITFRVVCSKGTYIRVLCEDIAKKLGTVGYMKSLRRTRIGKYKVEDAGKFIELENILENKVDIEEKDIKKLINGVAIKVNQDDGLVNIYSNRDYLGIGEIKSNNLKRKIICEN